MKFEFPAKALPLCALLAAALATLPGAALAQKRGGTLTIGTEAEFSGFNAQKIKIMNQNTAAPTTSVLETLFVYENGQIVPRLGLSFAEAPDRLSATVKLRQGVKFHDGTPFNADAVVAHYSWIMAPETGINIAMIAPLRRVEKVDDYTVRFVVDKPWSALQSALSVEEITNMIGSPTALKNDPDGFNRKPVGTGPFVFKEWLTGDRVVMDRNPNYWDPKLPYLDHLIYRVMPDANTRYQSIKSGQVDIGRTDVAESVVDAQKDKSLVVLRYDGSGAISWNYNNSREPFNDQRVRAAVTHAFNAKAMVDTLYLGTTEPTRELLGKNSPWYCPNVNWRGYDLDKAKALVKDYGKPIKFELVTVNTPAARRQAAMLQQFVKQAGMDATIRLVEQSNNVRVGISGDYQMDVWRFNDSVGDPDLTLSYYFGPKAASRHDTSKIEPLLAQARTEPDTAKRKQLYCQAEQVISDEAFQLIPIRQPVYAISNKQVKDVPQMLNSVIRTRAIWLDR